MEEENLKSDGLSDMTEGDGDCVCVDVDWGGGVLAFLNLCFLKPKASAPGELDCPPFIFTITIAGFNILGATLSLWACQAQSANCR